VAIVDLRCDELDDISKKTGRVCLNGIIKHINLVPGVYSLGLFLNSDLCSGDYLNILQIQITENISQSSFIQYPAEVRGTTVFNHTLTINNVS
jgi:hypothetical protein